MRGRPPVYDVGALEPGQHVMVKAPDNRRGRVRIAVLCNYWTGRLGHKVDWVHVGGGLYRVTRTNRRAPTTPGIITDHDIFA